MTPEDIFEQLDPMGFPAGDYRLEPFTLLVEEGPPGAFDNVQTFALHDNQYERRLDGFARDWRPLLVVGEEVFVGPSPDLLAHQLAACRFFDRPSQFGEYIVRQMHGFAIDHYEGYVCREESFEYDSETLTITGMATKVGRGQPPPVPFTTKAYRSGKTEFLPEKPKGPP